MLRARCVPLSDNAVASMPLGSDPEPFTGHSRGMIVIGLIPDDSGDIVAMVLRNVLHWPPEEDLTFLSNIFFF